jgi:hypothetical protein
VLSALISISSLTANEPVLICNDVVSLIFPIMESHHNYFIIKKASHLLMNICTVDGTENISKVWVVEEGRADD